MLYMPSDICLKKGIKPFGVLCVGLVLNSTGMMNQQINYRISVIYIPYCVRLYLTLY